LDLGLVVFVDARGRAGRSGRRLTMAMAAVGSDGFEPPAIADVADQWVSAVIRSKPQLARFRGAALRRHSLSSPLTV